MIKYGIKINSKDNVVTLVMDVKKGEEVIVKFKKKEEKYIVNENIPFGHKIAVKNINTGDDVIKFGCKIGEAYKNIITGDWVHIHNIKCDYKCFDFAKNGDTGNA